LKVFSELLFNEILICFLPGFNLLFSILLENERTVTVTESITQERRKTLLETSELRDATAEEILARFGNTENHPEEAITPYQEFSVENKTYYFTPGGFLYRKEPGTEEVGGFFCGYLTDEVWHHRTDDG
jgi:hypothetical protein